MTMTSDVAAQLAGAPSRHVLAISGMVCGGCARGVERALLQVPGVERVSVDQPGGRATVEGRAAGPALVAAVEAAGYSAKSVAAQEVGGQTEKESINERRGSGCCG